MQSFEYVRASDLASAIQVVSDKEGLPTLVDSQFLAGGTTILDLMKLDVMRPTTLVDINDLQRQLGQILVRDNSLHLGSLVRMAEAADHPIVQRDFPVVVQSLQLAASAQIRNMATLGGNVLQRTRCNYFRDTSWKQCNKRVPGSGCGALHGVNRKHAVLGTSENCIATYPGDFAQALIALDATVDVVGPSGPRVIEFESLHVAPGKAPERETILGAGEVITGFSLPMGAWTRRSAYLKIRDRESYEFALASAAVVLDLQDDIARDVHIALGGVATKPWRARAAEDVLKGKRITDETVREAADLAFSTAVTHGGNSYKPELGRRVLARALLQTARMVI
jgi:xanthine dehydrogenase YagS FAD-binding subunit